MTIKVAELTGGAFNWASARCEVFPPDAIAITDHGDGKEEVFFPLPIRDDHDNVVIARGTRWTPSSNWEQGGPIIEREKIEIM